MCITSDEHVSEHARQKKKKQKPETRIETSHGCEHDMTKLLVYAASHDTIKEKKDLGQIRMPINYVYTKYVLR